ERVRWCAVFAGRLEGESAADGVGRFAVGNPESYSRPQRLGAPWCVCVCIRCQGKAAGEDGGARGIWDFLRPSADRESAGCDTARIRIRTGADYLVLALLSERDRHQQSRFFGL